VLDLEVIRHAHQCTEGGVVVRHISTPNQHHHSLRRAFIPKLFENSRMSIAVVAHSFDDWTKFVLSDGRTFLAGLRLTHAVHLAYRLGRRTSTHLR
jgi:hypothetical protein